MLDTQNKSYYIISLIAGFEFKRDSVDLNSVRLCFQVFLEGSQKGKFNVPLPPVVSDPIFDKSTFDYILYPVFKILIL